MFQLLKTAEVALEWPLQPVQTARIANQPGATSDPEPRVQHRWQAVYHHSQKHRIWAKHCISAVALTENRREEKKIRVNNT